MNLKNKFFQIKYNLTHISSKESLGLFSMIIIIFLDFFILFAIFKGLDEHTSQLTTPHESIPYLCQNIIIEENWTKENKLENLSNVILSGIVDYDQDRNHVKKKLNPTCKYVTEKVETLKQNKEIVLLFQTRAKLSVEFSEIKNKLENTKTSYDTILLQKIAGDSTIKDADAGKIKQEFDDAYANFSRLSSQLNSLDTRINGNSIILDFWQDLIKTRTSAKETLARELKQREFWYPVKKIIMQMIFLIPLLCLFLFWNSRSLKKNLGLQILISSHLLIVTSIPVVLNIIETIYDIIPKKFLKYIWDILVSSNLVAIWHYIIILSAISLTMLIVYIVQKRIFNYEKLIEKRMAKGNCVECGKLMPVNSNACPFCGFHQNKKCTKCGKLTHVYGSHCKECGASLK